MSGALTSLISGLIAGTAKKELIKKVLFNAVLDLWAKKRRDKAEEAQRRAAESYIQQASQGFGTQVASGHPVSVIFGTVPLGGHLFDSTAPKEGGWPLYAAIGLARPKDMSQGIELVKFTDGTAVPVGSDGNIASHKTVTQSAPSGPIYSSVLLDNGFFDAVKIQNDSTKKALNATFKFFPKGGFSSAGGGVQVFDITDISYFQYINRGSRLDSTMTLSEGPSDGIHISYNDDLVIKKANGEYVTYPIRTGTVSSVFLMNGSYVTQAQFQTALKGYSGVGYTYNNQEVAGDPSKVYRTVSSFTSPTRGQRPTVVVTYTEISLQYNIEGFYLSGTGTAVAEAIGGPGSRILIWRYQGNKDVDSILQQSFGDNLKSNNLLAYMAVQVNDPGNQYKDVMLSTPSITALVRDRHMPYAQAYFTPGNGAVSTSTMWENPIAIIYEMWANPQVGLGRPNSSINMADAITAFNACEAYDADIGDKAWRIGGFAITDEVRFEDFMKNILEHVHGSYWDDGELHLSIDTAALVPASPIVIDQRNIVRDESKDGQLGKLRFTMKSVGITDRPNRFDIKYVKPEYDYVADYYLSVQDPAQRFIDGRDIVKKVDLPGFQHDKYAEKHAIILMNRQRTENQFFEIGLDPTGLEVDTGKVVLLKAFKGASDTPDTRPINLEVLTGRPLSRLYIASANSSPIPAFTPGAEIVSGSYSAVVEGFGYEIINGVERFFVDTSVNWTHNFDQVYSGNLLIYYGLKQLLDDTYARVVEAKMSENFDIDVILHKFEPGSYSISGNAYQTDRVSLPDLVFIDQENRVPPRPLFLDLRYESNATENGTLVQALTAYVGNRAFPSVERTVIEFYAMGRTEEDSSFQVYTLGAVTMQQGTDYATIILKSKYEWQSGEPLKFFALAISYNQNNLSSEVADSRVDIVDEFGNPVFPDVSTDYELVPADVGFIEAECYYGNSLRVVSEPYDGDIPAGLELRTEDDNWSLNLPTEEDNHFFGRYSKQVNYSQRDKLPLQRSLTFYVKAYSHYGKYSTNAGSITLTDTIPIQIPSGNITILPAGNTVFIDISPYFSGAYESDVIEYRMYNDAGDTLLTRSSVPYMSFTVPYSEFSGDTYTLNFKLMAVDRLTDALDDGILSVSLQAILTKIQTAEIELEALRNSFDRQLFRLDEWGSADYSASFGEIMSLNSSVGQSFTQELVLDPEETYVVSGLFRKVSGSGPVQITISGPVTGTPIVESSTDTNFVNFAVMFTTTSQTDPIPRTVFTISSAEPSEAKLLTLSKGELARSYSLHIDDMPVAGKAVEQFNQLNSQALVTANSIRAMSQKLIEQGSRINQSEYGISLSVRKDKAVSEIALSPEGVMLSGRKIIVDGETTFVNNNNRIYGTFVENVTGNRWKVFVSSIIDLPEVGNTKVVYQLADANDFPSTNDDWSDAMTFTVVEKEPSTGYVVVDVTGDTPSLKGFWIDSNSTSVTKIDGGRILADSIQTDHLQANSIVADKIAAKTIGAEKIIAEELLADVIKIYGKNNIVLDPEVGLMIFSNENITSTSFYSEFWHDPSESYAFLTSTLPASIEVGDYIEITDSLYFNGTVRKVLAVDTTTVPSYTLVNLGNFSQAPIGNAGETGVKLIKRQITNGSYILLSIDTSGVPTIQMYQGTSSTPKATKWSPEAFDLRDGSIQIGSGDESFFVDDEGNMWLGDESFINAKFRVDKFGNVRMRDGSIQIGSGDELFSVDTEGNFWIGDESFIYANFRVDKFGNARIGTGSNAAYFDNTGNFWMGASTFGSAPFSVSNTGAIAAASISLDKLEKVPVTHTGVLNDPAVATGAALYGESVNITLRPGLNIPVKTYKIQHSAPVANTTYYLYGTTESAVHCRHVASITPFILPIYASRMGSTFAERRANIKNFVITVNIPIDSSVTFPITSPVRYQIRVAIWNRTIWHHVTVVSELAFTRSSGFFSTTHNVDILNESLSNPSLSNLLDALVSNGDTTWEVQTEVLWRTTDVNHGPIFRVNPADPAGSVSVTLHQSPS